MTQQLTKNVYCEVSGLRGCNYSFVTTSEGVVMTDTPQLPSDALKLREEISRYGTLRYIINIEPHGDHYQGSYFFEGTVVGHEGTREQILATPLEPYVDMLKEMEPESLPLVENYHYRAPTITFNEKMTIYLGEHTFHLINYPGHTPYQVGVYVPEERVIFTGDNVVRQMPFFPPQAIPYDWIASLKCMQELDVDIVVPGHGDICDKSYLAEMADGIQLWIDVVTDVIKKGMSLEEAQENINLVDSFPTSHLPMERVLQMQLRNVASVYEFLMARQNK